MLEEDLAALLPPFSEEERTDGAWERALRERMGGGTPAADQLLLEVVNDLDAQVFGIGWWNADSTLRRILVGDQLIVCTRDSAVSAASCCEATP
jgi:hypothetical protein